MLPMFNHFGLITPPKREIFQAACLRWETWDTGREELSRHSGSLQGSDYLRGDQNTILTLQRSVCYSQKRENGGLGLCRGEKRGIKHSFLIFLNTPCSILIILFMGTDIFLNFGGDH